MRRASLNLFPRRCLSLFLQPLNHLDREYLIRIFRNHLFQKLDAFSPSPKPSLAKAARTVDSIRFLFFRSSSKRSKFGSEVGSSQSSESSPSFPLRNGKLLKDFARSRRFANRHQYTGLKIRMNAGRRQRRRSGIPVAISQRRLAKLLRGYSRVVVQIAFQREQMLAFAKILGIVPRRLKVIERVSKFSIRIAALPSAL